MVDPAGDTRCATCLAVAPSGHVRLCCRAGFAGGRAAALRPGDEKQQLTRGLVPGGGHNAEGYLCSCRPAPSPTVSGNYMRLFILILFLLTSCSFQQGDIRHGSTNMNFTEEEILYKIDLAFEGQPDGDFPIGNKGAYRSNSFLDLEHGYFETAGSKIHLYADSTRWAVVFEKCGYDNRGLRAEIELDYIGNCINYPTYEFQGSTTISNSNSITLVTYDEYERIRNKNEKGIADFELISPTATELMIHGQKAKIEHDIKKYLALGIKPSDYKNPNNLIGYADIIRFFSDTEPEIVSATEEEIKEHLPIDIPKLMTLDKFHFVSFYNRDDLPSSQETYQLIAKILTTKDTTLWRPKLKPNNHWTNWESGNL